MRKVPLEKGRYRVIKISREALMEFIYESFLDNQEMYLETEPTETLDHFYIDLENESFICCAERADNPKYSGMNIDPRIDIAALCRNLDDTTNTMYADVRYRDYTEEELIEISEKFRKMEKYKLKSMNMAESRIDSEKQR